MTDEKNLTQNAPEDANGIEQIKSVEGAIEAILYAAGYPVKYEKIAEVLGAVVFVGSALVYGKHTGLTVFGLITRLYTFCFYFIFGHIRSPYILS